MIICEKRAVIYKASAVACLTLSPLLFTRPVPMIHRVTRSLDFGRNITAFISWPLFCRQLSPRGWNLTRHVDKEICPRRQHYFQYFKVEHHQVTTLHTCAHCFSQCVIMCLIVLWSCSTLKSGVEVGRLHTEAFPQSHFLGRKSNVLNFFTFTDS